MVIGTTGFSPKETKSIEKFAAKYGVVFSPNMSIGVNLTFKLLEVASSLFKKSYDVEILESHHRNKIDSPSGTALEMAKIISSSTSQYTEDDYRFSRFGSVGPRKKNEIGFSVVRGGDIVGEHTVIFAGVGEVIEVKHRSTSRNSYATGALIASQFLHNKWPCITCRM